MSRESTFTNTTDLHLSDCPERLRPTPTPTAGSPLHNQGQVGTRKPGPPQEACPLSSLPPSSDLTLPVPDMLTIAITGAAYFP